MAYSLFFYADKVVKGKMERYGYERSNITGEEYCLKDYIRVVDPKQCRLYIKHDVYPIDMYTTTDIETGEDKLIMLFSKKESQPLYVLWKNRELK